MASHRKSTEATVFVRFVPPTADVKRHQLEDLFSEIGPVKKSAVVRNQNKDADGRSISSYAFVRFANNDDAVLAARTLNDRKLPEQPDIRLRVELASAAGQQQKGTNKGQGQIGRTQETSNDQSHAEEPSHHKKSARLILRNLSFYATEKNIRQALRAFGEVEEVHLPTVNTAGKVQSRGFCFVTFTNRKDAQRCVSSKDPLTICKRPVSVAFSLQKQAYESMKAKTKKEEKEAEEFEQETTKDHENESESESGDDDDDDDDDDQDKMDEDKEDTDKDEVKEDHGEASADEKGEENDKDESQVSEKRSLFVRNLPFDATRHDLFQLFFRFGHIEGIYIVKDKGTGIPKGTAFVAFSKDDSAQKVLDEANGDSFVAQRDSAAASGGGGIMLKGRRLLINLAVDKDTAFTLKRKEDTTTTGKDRRNLYLKIEGRVEDNWESLPEGDKLKRQTAWSDKTTKLRSPLFFVNPNRLSVRNLSKQIDEKAFKKLIVDATLAGLKRKLVTEQDQIAHWRASGDFATRDILQKMQENKEDVIPPLDTQNIKKYIPSVFLSRDFGGSKASEKGSSRGFGFVEFEHHVHALACLRQLNNNPVYSESFTANGKAVAEQLARSGGKKKKKKKKAAPDDESNEIFIPRLIVEFTVENKVKAKQQAEHRVQQQANKIKQKLEQKEKHLDDEGQKKKQKRSRGAIQREKKRQKRLAAESGLASDDKEEAPVIAKPIPQEDPKLSKRKEKPLKPKKKKRKIDPEEETFNSLVESHTKKVPALADESSTGRVNKESSSLTKKSGKRWFD